MSHDLFSSSMSVCMWYEVGGTWHVVEEIIEYSYILWNRALSVYLQHSNVLRVLCQGR